MPQDASHDADHRALYRAMFEQSLVGIAITRGEDDAVLEVNDAMCTMLGYSRDEFKQLGFAGVTHPADLEETLAAIRRVVTGEVEQVRFEKRYVTKDGRTIWALFHLGAVAVEGGPKKILRQVWDITDRHEAERKLRESEGRYRAASEGSLNLFCLMQAVRDANNAIVNFKIIDANERCWKMLNTTREELMGKLLSELPRSKPETFLKEFAKVVETGRTHEEEFPIDWPGLAPKWMHHQIVKAGDGVAISSRDITERKISEQTLRQSEEHYRKLADSNRRLLSEVNHRVRNNLASLLAMVAMLRRRHLSTPDFAADLEGKLRSMATIHNTMAGADWQEVSLERLVQRILASMKHTASQPIEIRLNGPTVELSGRQCVPLAMTLHELFTNSCKYGAHLHPDGQIDITWQVDTAAAQAKQHVTLRWIEQGGPPIAAPVTSSLGLALIEGFVEHDLAGKVTLAFPPTGAAHVMEFDLATKEEIARNSRSVTRPWSSDASKETIEGNDACEPGV